MRRVLLVFGTRPEAIKMAPVIERLHERPDIFEPIVAVTAQHREMLDQVLALFGIFPDYDLDLMRPGQALEDVFARSVTQLTALVRDLVPDIVLVQGDTASTFAGALAAYFSRVPVGHIEAGLRSDDKYQPYPEEINRRLTTHLADVHFAPTTTARERLLREGIDPAAVHVTGNTVVDAVLEAAETPYVFADERLAAATDPGAEHRLIVLTAHRRENWGAPLRSICLAARDVLDATPDAELVFPMHRNPIVRDTATEVLGEHPRAYLIEPLDYLPFVKLAQAATLVLSDSGGIQEEAPALNTPVLVLREVTERPEAVEAGAVRLVGTDRTVIRREALALLRDPDEYARMVAAVNPFGDGTAARRIVDILEGMPMSGGDA